MNQLPNLSSFPLPEDAMEYADDMIVIHGINSTIGVDAVALSNAAYSVLKRQALQLAHA